MAAIVTIRQLSKQLKAREGEQLNLKLLEQTAKTNWARLAALIAQSDFVLLKQYIMLRINNLEQRVTVLEARLNQQILGPHEDRLSDMSSEN